MTEQELIQAANLGKLVIPEHLIPAKQWLCMDDDSLLDDQLELVNEYRDLLNDFAGYVASVHDLQTCWCFCTEDFTAPYEDQTATSVYYSGGWGESAYQDLPPNPTVLDVWKAADQCIILSGDRHHTFIEDLTNDGHGELAMLTGS